MRGDMRGKGLIKNNLSVQVRRGNGEIHAPDEFHLEHLWQRRGHGLRSYAF